MAFTTIDNTTGYTQAELDALNAELAERLAEIDPDDTDARAEAEKAFADEVSRR
jgi:hypothetical protein